MALDDGGASWLSSLYGSARGGLDSLAERTPGGYWGVGGAAAGGASDLYSLIQNVRAQMERSRIQSILADPKKFSRYTGEYMKDALPGIQRTAGSEAAVRGLSGGAGQNIFAEALARNYLDAAGGARANLTGALPSGAGLPVGALAKILETLGTLKKLRESGGTVAPRTDVGFDPARFYGTGADASLGNQPSAMFDMGAL